MLIISGVVYSASMILNEYPENSIEAQLSNEMILSNEKYQYDNLNQLKFELNLRREIVNSAINLNNSDLAFANFKDSKCNHNYWKRVENGGFLLLENVKPNEAINDIFTNGNKYATECATAIMIIYFKGLLNVFGDEIFNKVFPKIYLMDWDVREPLLKEVNIIQSATDILLGDRGYFQNPDFNPETPEWQGENIIVLLDSMYYGHGIGIAKADIIIQALNSKRREGAAQTAYLQNGVGRPNFKKLYNIYYNALPQPATLVWGPFPQPLSRNR